MKNKDKLWKKIYDKSGIENPKAVISAILFSFGDAVEYKKIAKLFNCSVSEIKSIIHEMALEYHNDNECGIDIIEYNNLVQMGTKPSLYEYISKIVNVPKELILTPPLLETLTIIAYRQPVTKFGIKRIRGVDCDNELNKLIKYGLVTELGRESSPGRPILFGTTDMFLRDFNLKSIDDLPEIGEFPQISSLDGFLNRKTDLDVFIQDPL